jgi:hypothetical protein
VLFNILSNSIFILMKKTLILLSIIYLINFQKALAQYETKSGLEGRPIGVTFDSNKNTFTVHSISSLSGKMLSDAEVAEKEKEPKAKKSKWAVTSSSTVNPFKAAKEAQNAQLGKSKLVATPASINDVFKVTSTTFEISSKPAPPKSVSKSFYTTRLLEADKKYTYYEGDNIGNEPILSLDKFTQTYKDIPMGKENTSCLMYAVGEGLMGTKNLKAFSVVNKSTFTPSGYYNTQATPFFDEQIKTYANYTKFNDHTNDLSNPEGTRFVSILRNKGEDNWEMYKNYQIFYLDAAGKVLKQETIQEKFARTVNFFNHVYNEKGEKVGVLLVLSASAAMKKSVVDPVENKFQVYFSDYEGNVKLKTDIIYGNPENSRCFNPIFAMLKDNKLKIFNVNADKMLKPFTEIVNIDEKGAITSEKQTDQHNIFNDWRKVEWNVIPASGKFIIAGASTDDSKNFVAEPANPNVLPSPYRGIYVGVFDPATYTFGKSTSFGYSCRKASTELIEDTANQQTLIVTTNNTNYLVQIKPEGIKSTMANGTIKAPMTPSSAMPGFIGGNNLKNYSIDKTNREILFLYTPYGKEETNFIDINKLRY